MVKRTTPYAIVHLSWNALKPREILGGVGGSAFAVSRNTILTASHVVAAEAFRPLPGMTHKRLFVCGIRRPAMELREEHLTHIPKTDVAIIRGLPTKPTFEISTRKDDVTAAHIHGWTANSNDFSFSLTKNGPILGSMKSADGLQSISLGDPIRKVFEISSSDVKMENVLCWCGSGRGMQGASGGPCVDQDGRVLGIASFATPADAQVRSFFGAVDIRWLVSTHHQYFPDQPELAWLWRT